MPNTSAQGTQAAYPGFWSTLATGFLIGIGSIAPGVSGGAIAVVFNLYDPITDALAHFYRDFKNKMKFLIPLCLGAGASILLFSQIIAYFSAHYNMATRCLFVGLMAGTLPSVFHTAGRQGFRWWYPLPMLAAAAGTIWLSCAHLFVYTGGEGGAHLSRPADLRSRAGLRHHRAGGQLLLFADGGRAVRHGSEYHPHGGYSPADSLCHRLRHVRSSVR